MINWYQIIACSFTNGIRIFVCFCWVTILLKLERPSRSMTWLSLICGMAAAVLSFLMLPQIGVMVFEVLTILLILYKKYHYKPRICLFLTICFEMAVALWDFLFSAGFQITFRYSTLDSTLQKYLIPIWTVRLLMIGITLLAAMQGNTADKRLGRIFSMIAMFGMFGVIILSEQSSIIISDDQLFTWSIFSVVLIMAILFYRVNCQYEMEKKIAQLEKEKNGLLMRDYQMLKNTYAVNAKLFHDFYNHIEALQRYLIKDKTKEAIQYIEDLRSPLKTITQALWTGDEAVDYLINSKIALAASRKIRVSTNIEFPRRTNIRSVDLVAILGNLLDNALEAIEEIEDNLRFINLTIRRINDMLIIKVENGCHIAPAITDGDLQTSKTNKDLHGWGLKSVRTAAEYYDGTIETEYCNHTFRAVVTLSFEAVKA